MDKTESSEVEALRERVDTLEGLLAGVVGTERAAFLSTGSDTTPNRRINVTISDRDYLLLKAHKARTCEGASAFMRRMIAQELEGEVE